MNIDSNDLESRLREIKQKQGLKAYHDLVNSLPEDAQLVVRMMFESGCGWMETVYLLVWRFGDDLSFHPSNFAVRQAQRRLLELLPLIRCRLDVEQSKG